MVESAKEAVHDLFIAYDGTPAVLRIALVSFQNGSATAHEIESGTYFGNANKQLRLEMVLDGFLSTCAGGTPTDAGLH